MPKRIQRKRTKGWRIPENAIYVGRPTIWGNPFKVGTATLDECIRWYRKFYFEADMNLWTHKVCQISKHGVRITTISEVRRRLHELRGHDLACWCPLTRPCHSDVLLELANA